jgi:hypothetical protein
MSPVGGCIWLSCWLNNEKTTEAKSPGTYQCARAFLKFSFILRHVVARRRSLTCLFVVWLARLNLATANARFNTTGDPLIVRLIIK